MDKFIDEKTGYIYFENGKVVKENDSLEYIKSLKLGAKDTFTDMGNGWMHWVEYEIPYKGQYLTITFILFEKKLKNLDMELRLENEVKPISWEQYDKLNYAVIENQNHKAFFEKYMPAIRWRTWGMIGYCIESKAGFSRMFINFDNKSPA